MSEKNEGSEKTATIKQIATASLLGTSLEWFDFFIFSTMSAIVFNQLFFTNLSPLMGTVSALATFATGFLTRPLGAIIFGHFGDKIGRKSTMVITMMLMGIGTFAVGVLPTYETIGVWAPLLLILLRLIQGLGLGGEWGGAVLICVEHASQNKRGLYGSIPQLGVPLGSILSAGVIALVTMLPQEQFLSWGWRLPFQLSILLVMAGLFVRLRIMETEAFNNAKEEGSLTKLPIMEVIRSTPKRTLLALGTRFSESATSNIFGTFMLVYITQEVGMPRTFGVLGTMVASTLALILIPIAGALSDRFGRRLIYLAGAGFTVLFAFPAFWLMDTGNPIMIWLSLVLGFAVGWGLMYGPQAAFYAELFDPSVRYSAIGFVYSIGALPTGAIASAVATVLLAWAGDSWPISLYLILMALITIVTTFMLPETFQRNISEPENKEKSYDENVNITAASDVNE